MEEKEVIVETQEETKEQLQERKTVFYKVYKAWKNDNEVCDLYSMVKLHIKVTDEEITEWKEQIEWIDDCIKIDKEWLFGTELEYGGRNNRLLYDRDDEEEIIETIKHDCSVSGDGTEYNLKPKRFGEEDLARKLESFCFRAANHNCVESWTAGEHFHYSWPKVNGLFGSLIYAMAKGDESIYMNSYEQDQTKEKIGGKYSEVIFDKKPLFAESSNSGVANIGQVEMPYEARRKRKWTEENIKSRAEELKITDERVARTISIYRAFKTLYSTSNRSGNENYGLAGDATRGYTRHETIELRCWKTTLDYRSIIARAHVGRFVLRWLIKYILLDKFGFVRNEEQDIWEDLRKDEYVYSCFKYLAFHSANSHKVGYTQEELEILTRTSHATALAIKARTKMFKKALNKNNPESNAKELMKMI